MNARLASRLTLRQLLSIDAATCLAMAALLCSAASTLGPLLGLPATFVWWSGAVLLPCAMLMVAAAARKPPSAPLAIVVVLGNIAWFVASIAVVAVVFDPTPIGIGFVLAQAAAVGVLAMLEYRALPASERALA